MSTADLTPADVLPVVLAAHAARPHRDPAVIAALSAALDCSLTGAGCGRREVMIDAVSALDGEGGRFGLSASELAEYGRLTGRINARLTNAEIGRVSELRAKHERWMQAAKGGAR